MTRMLALGRRALAAALLLAIPPASSATEAVVGGEVVQVATSAEGGMPSLSQGRVLVRYEAATLSIAGGRWQAEGGGVDGAAAIDASHAEAGEEAGEGEGGGDGLSGGRAEYGGYRGFVPSSPASLSLEERVSRIEGYLPHLATKADLLAVEVRLEKAIAALRVEMSELRTEVEVKLREQFRDFLVVISVMLSALGTLQLLVVKYILLPGDREAQRQREKPA